MVERRKNDDAHYRVVCIVGREREREDKIRHGGCTFSVLSAFGISTVIG